MKVSIITLLLIGCLQGASQLPVLSGYVTIQNSGGKSAFPAQVTSAGASATGVNSVNGKFDLTYNTKQPGADVELEIIKMGYEVVNKNELLTRIPEDAKTNKPVRIYLCPAGQWQKAADSFYGIGYQFTIDNYEKKIKLLSKQFAKTSAEFRSAITTLLKERDVALAQLKDWSEILAQTNFDDAHERGRKEFNFIKKKQIDSAMALMNEEIILKELALTKNDKKKAKQLDSISALINDNAERAFNSLIQELMNKARLSQQKLDWKTAGRIYELVLKEGDLKTEIINEIANFFYEQNKTDKAEAAFKLGLLQCTSQYHKAALLNSYGSLLSHSPKPEDAEKYYLEGLEILKELLKKDSAIFQDLEGKIYHNLGMFYAGIPNYKKAELCFRNALVAKFNLNTKTQSHYGPIINTCNSYALMLTEIDSTHRAENMYKVSLSIARWLYLQDTTKYEEIYSSICANFSSFFRTVKLYDSSLTYSKEAIHAFQDMVRKNPEKYIRNLGMAWYNLGNLLTDMRSFNDAKKAYDNALDIRKDSIKEHSITDYIEWAETLESIGYIYHIGLKSDSLCKRRYDEAVEVLRNYTLTDIKGREALAKVLKNYATDLYDGNNRDEAKKHLNEALALYLQLNTERKGAYLSQIASVKRKSGDWHTNDKLYGEAEILYTEAKNIFQQLALKAPDSVTAELGNIYVNLGALKRATKNYHAASVYLEIAYETYKKLFQTRQKNKDDVWRAGLMLCYSLKSQLLSEGRSQPDIVGAALHYLNEIAQYDLLSTAEESYITLYNNLKLFFNNVNNGAFFDWQKVKFEIELLAEEAELEKGKCSNKNIGYQICTRLDSMYKVQPDNEEIQSLLSNKYAVLLACELANKKFAEVEALSRKLLVISPQTEKVNSYLALSMLLQGKWEQAREVYIKYKDKPFNNESTWRQQFLDDINTICNSLGVSHPDIIKAKELLK